MATHNTPCEFPPVNFLHDLPVYIFVMEQSKYPIKPIFHCFGMFGSTSWGTDSNPCVYFRSKKKYITCISPHAGVFPHKRKPTAYTHCTGKIFGKGLMINKLKIYFLSQQQLRNPASSPTTIISHSSASLKDCVFFVPHKTHKL